MQYKKILCTVFITLLGFSQSNFSQTSSFGNYEIYTRESASSSIGFLTNHLLFSDSIRSYDLTQKGVMYINERYGGDLGTFILADDQQIRIATENVFKIGFSTGKHDLDSISPAFKEKSVKYYVITVDVFSLNLAADYTYVFDYGSSLTLKFGLGLLNLGATLAFLDKGTFKDNSIGVITVIPFTMKPSLLFDFGRFGMGIGFYINPYNILSYRNSSSNFFRGDKGVQFGDDTIKNFAFEITFTY